MKNFVKILVVAIIAVVTFSSCADKFGAKNSLHGWRYNHQTHRAEVYNMDDDPVGAAETNPEVIAADTVMLQGNAGAEIYGGWSKCDITGMGASAEFQVKYDGSKIYTLAALVDLKLLFEERPVYALDSFCLVGTMREVSREEAPFLQTSIASLKLFSESGDVVAGKDVVFMVGAALRDTVIIHDTTTIHTIDTVHIHHRDTVYVHDTVNMRDTITLFDTVYVHDSVEVIRTTTVSTEHLSWSSTAQLINGKLYVSGTDRITVVVEENGVEVSRHTATFHHWSRFRLIGFNGVVFTAAQNVCVDIVNGIATIAGQQFQIVWEADEISDAAVIVNGVDYKSQLTPCHAEAVQLCATPSGNLVIHFAEASGDEIATWSTTYTVSNPNPFFPDATILDIFVVRRHVWQNDVTGTVETWAKVRRNSDNVVEYRYAMGYQNLTASSFSVEDTAANNGLVLTSSVISTIDTRIAGDWWPVHVNVNQSQAPANPHWVLGVTHSDALSNNSGYTTDAKDVSLNDVCHVSMVNTTVGVGAGNSHIARWNSTTGNVVSVDGNNTVLFNAHN